MLQERFNNNRNAMLERGKVVPGLITEDAFIIPHTDKNEEVFYKIQDTPEMIDSRGIYKTPVKEYRIGDNPHKTGSVEKSYIDFIDVAYHLLQSSVYLSFIISIYHFYLNGSYVYLIIPIIIVLYNLLAFKRIRTLYNDMLASRYLNDNEERRREVLRYYGSELLKWDGDECSYDIMPSGDIIVKYITDDGTKCYFLSFIEFMRLYNITETKKDT